MQENPSPQSFAVYDNSVSQTRLRPTRLALQFLDRQSGGIPCRYPALQSGIRWVGRPAHNGKERAQARRLFNSAMEKHGRDARATTAGEEPQPGRLFNSKAEGHGRDARATTADKESLENRVSAKRTHL